MPNTSLHTDETDEAIDDGNDEDPGDFASIFARHIKEYGGAVEAADEDDGEADGAKKLPKPPATRGSKPGTDEILKHLKQHWPEAADVVKGMQGKMHNNINESNELRDSLVDELHAVKALKERYESSLAGPEKPTESSTPEPKIYTEAQLELVRQAAKDLGMVFRSDLEAESDMKNYETLLEKSMAEGVEQYGESFGTVGEDGSITLNSTLAAQIEEVTAQIETQGLTPLQLATLAGLNRTTAESPISAPTSDNGPTRSAKALRAANTLTRATGGDRAGNKGPQINSAGDDAGDVFDKSWLVAKRKLGIR
jgi:hypothetical protein